MAFRECKTNSFLFLLSPTLDYIKVLLDDPVSFELGQPFRRRLARISAQYFQDCLRHGCFIAHWNEVPVSPVVNQLRYAARAIRCNHRALASHSLDQHHAQTPRGGRTEPA